MSTILYKIASEDVEFQQIHALNYATFAEEIPQHPANPTRLLVDAYHAENTYLIALDGSQLAGMIAVRAHRPFSLDRKFAATGLEPVDMYLPRCCRPCEVRLLSIASPYRHTALFAGLIHRLALHCQRCEYDLALVSATTRQLKLYRHLGFVPFGPRLGTPEACFQPMYLTHAAYLASVRSRLRAPATSVAFSKQGAF